MGDGFLSGRATKLTDGLLANSNWTKDSKPPPIRSAASCVLSKVQESAAAGSWVISSWVPSVVPPEVKPSQTHPHSFPAIADPSQASACLKWSDYRSVQ
jgi:hypothetical protein